MDQGKETPLNSAANGAQPQDGSEVVVMPIHEEQIKIERREVETGRTRIVKEVERTKSVVDEPLYRVRHETERVPIGKVVSAPEQPRYEGDRLIIPVYEERIFVEKRLVLVEEIHVIRKVEEFREPREVELLHERVTVNRSAGPEEQ